MAGQPIRWARLETGSRDAGPAPGLEARIHDPLWLLGRQWQFGELTADAEVGSAIAAEITVEVTPLTGVGAEPFDARTIPLEALVEAEDVHAGSTARALARAGQHFERLLTAHFAGTYAAAYRAHYPLAPAANSAADGFTTLLAGRTIDAVRLHADLTAALGRPHPRLPAEPAIAAADVDHVRAAAEAWLAWWDELALSPAGGPGAWIPERMEHRFTLTADDGSVLEAEQYADGQLDWSTFTASAPATTATQPREPVTVVPSLVTFPGMAASRLWEFEDARVDFGAVEAEPEDLGRMLLTEFALVYGGDWLLVPLELEVGARARIVRLDVSDTFGRTITIPATAHLDSGWGMFGTTTAQGTTDDALLLCPALPACLQGTPIEEVLLLRDEAANLAWAVERAVEGQDGGPVDLARDASESAPPPAPPAPDPDTLVYRLRTDVPANWHPLIPQRDAPTDPEMTFRLGTLGENAPRGRLLAPSGLTIREEEVSRAGARVTRAYQLARWVDGSTFLWLGRRKATGGGEGASGLRFDVMGTEPTQS